MVNCKKSISLLALVSAVVGLPYLLEYRPASTTNQNAGDSSDGATVGAATFPNEDSRVRLGSHAAPLVATASTWSSSSHGSAASQQWNGGKPTVNTSGYHQQVRYERGGQTITVIEVEYGITPQTWYRSEKSFSTSFPIEYVSYRTADEFYVFGLARNGDDIIESWTLTAIDGEYKHSVPGSTTPLGVPRPGALTSSLTVAGGTFIPPGNRTPSAQPSDTRNEIFRGPSFGGVMCAAVDPEGRFLLILSSQDSTLFQLELAEGATADALYTTNDIPELSQIGSIGRGLHSSGDRAVILTPAGNPDWHASPIRITIFDYENDGLFDNYFVLNEDVFESVFSGTWQTNFRDY